MIQPTRRAVALFALGVPLSLFLAVSAPRLWALSFDWGVVVLLAIAVDGALAFPRRYLRVGLDAPDRVYVGERGTITAVIQTTPHRRTARFALLCEQHGELDPPEIVTAELTAGREVLRAALAVVPRRRGRISIDRLWVRWQGPLLLAQFTQRVAINRSIDVWPNVHAVESAALQFFAREAVFGTKVQRQKGQGTEFEALRDYAPGLDHRFIDWKHSARHRQLLCKEFETERNHQIVLSFDTGHLMLEPIDGIPRLDHAINAGLLLAWISLRSGDFVGIYGFDAAVREYLGPGRGMSSFARIRRATAELDYRREETNFTLGLAELNRRLRRRALVVLFTDFIDTVTAELMIDSIGQIANRHVVVFVTLRGSVLQRTIDAAPDSFAAVAQAVVAHDFLRDRGIVLERLVRLGIHCLDVSPGNLSSSLINRYLLIKERGLI
jgi:uncharacterized protein (DUF58 family)